MPWVAIDDQFPIHRKVTRLSDPAFRLHVSAICWANRNLTDGAVSPADLPHVAPGMRRLERLVTELLDAGLWDADGDSWIIHNYLEYQPSKSTIQQLKDAKKEAGQFGNHRRWHEQRGVVDPKCPYCRR